MLKYIKNKDSQQKNSIGKKNKDEEKIINFINKKKNRNIHKDEKVKKEINSNNIEHDKKSIKNFNSKNNRIEVNKYNINPNKIEYLKI